MEEKKKRQGGKKAPAGYYTSAEARKKLGLSPSTFIGYVQKGKIKRYVPPLHREGYYSQREIDQLAENLTAFLVQEEVSSPLPVSVEVRFARPEDTPGVAYVLTSRGWGATSPEQRAKYYEINPHIDLIILVQGKVAGYLSAIPYTPDVLATIMHNNRYKVQPSDILPYIPGHTYDLYVGEAVIQTMPNHRIHAGGLIRRFIEFLEVLASQDILIHRMYAVSDQPDGQKLCKDLGFQQDIPQEGDLFPRYVLDLTTSMSSFAIQYREITLHGKQLREYVQNIEKLFQENAITLHAFLDTENEEGRRLLRAAGFPLVEKWNTLFQWDTNKQ
jgi:hypothetical protein